jgi:hypothetical protein
MKTNDTLDQLHELVDVIGNEVGACWLDNDDRLDYAKQLERAICFLTGYREELLAAHERGYG